MSSSGATFKLRMELETRKGAVRTHREKTAAGDMSRTSEKKASGRNVHKMVLDEKDATKFLKQFTEQQSTGKENGPSGQSIKVAYKQNVSMYPTPGNILHTGRQIPRTPGPGVLPLLPSQVFAPDAANLSFETLYKCLSQSTQKANDNQIPQGKQLERTVVSSDPHETTGNCNIVEEILPHVKNSQTNATSPEHSYVRSLNTANSKPTQSVTQESADLDVKAQENVDPKVKSHVNKDNRVSDSGKSVNWNRRISELPVKGLNPLHVSGLLRNLPGYECCKEDLEFLNHMGNQERAKQLKAELLSLRRERIASSQDKELAFAKKEKIEHDIQNMRRTFEQTVHLGRAFLCRTRDPSTVSALSDRDVLKQLNPTAVQLVLDEERIKLLSAQKELAKRKQDAPSPVNPTEEELSSRIESCNHRVKEAEVRVLKLQEEVIALQQHVEETQKEVADTEDRLQKKSAQIQSSKKLTPSAEEIHSLTEAEQEKVDRRLQRLVRRKELYLEREMMLARIRQNLQ